jgi:methylmalonyl-CoA/ethylmalonyl-CoA epimerase
MRFDHLGIVVSDLASGRHQLEGAFGITRWTQEYLDPLQEVHAQFGRCPSGICYELVAPQSASSPVARAAAAKANPIHHVAYLVDNLPEQRAQLVSQGFVATGEAKPGIVFGDRPIQFFVSRLRLLVELIEAPDYRHVFDMLPASMPVL